jgi:glycosyltransferase involved in cell wall biosynthesis
MMMNSKYVLVTAARNEEKFIETTINSIVSQTIMPLKWVIVNDGSVDRTDEIVNEYSSKFDFIELIRLNSSNNRNFASKVIAIKAGLEKLINSRYKFLGNLDADVKPENNYFELLIKKFFLNSDLGIAGGKIYESVNGKLIEEISSEDSVGGMIQFFRRECYEQIGGYLPLVMGGEDTIAEVMSRMHGWKVQKFYDISAIHCRPSGAAQGNAFSSLFKLGIRESLYGTLPLFEALKCIKRVGERPYLFGSILRMYGYIWGSLFEEHQHIPEEVIHFYRKEQKQKIRLLFKKIYPSGQ